MTENDVAIIGAGSAGVAAARTLRAKRPDLSIRLLEAADRIGGRAHTITTGGLPIDLGCGWLHGARTNAWMHVAREIGQPVDTTPAPWDRDERHWGMSDEDGASASASLMEFFERAEAEDPMTPDKPLSAFLETGNRWNPLIEAIGTYITGDVLSRVSALDYRNYDPGPSPDWRVPNGYGTLIATAAAGIDCALETHVSAIRLIEKGMVEIETSRGMLRAKAVVVTVSTNVLAAGRIAFDPPLADKIEAASNLPLGLNNKLFLSLDADSDIRPETQLIGSPDKVDTASYHIRPFGRDLIEGYFGAALALDMEKGGLEAAADFARGELAKHFGHDFTRNLKPVALSGWAAEPLVGGAYSYARPGYVESRRILAAPFDNRLFFAGEACSIDRYSTAHGAYETGVSAAEAALAALRAK